MKKIKLLSAMLGIAILLLGACKKQYDFDFSVNTIQCADTEATLRLYNSCCMPINVDFANVHDTIPGDTSKDYIVPVGFCTIEWNNNDTLPGGYVVCFSAFGPTDSIFVVNVKGCQINYVDVINYGYSIELPFID